MITPIITGMAMVTDAALYRLLTWLSPSYPVGAFAYSQGLESAISGGGVRDVDTVRQWLLDSLEFGALWSDAMIFARSHDAAFAGDRDALFEINAFACAFQPTRELRLETLAQGRAFMEVTAKAWPCDAIAHLSGSGREIAYPLAVASAAAGHGIACNAALDAWLHAAVSNLVSAAIRLVPLGQTEGQCLIAGIEDDLRNTRDRAIDTPLDALSTASLAMEILSMNHEMQETRLFRS
ncbi:urease accessory protein UreF [Rhizobiales bacterium]|uniref:urease accessory protein UreF n=1 Tax=Hongsoonwoonella zoysiae TaxID=2821844 RepID=UPI00156101E6|nr:urease accessory protein UreF [Hongsoonwoonella zoysiae]NRG19486.1 urease accessory protein UreF [Hongsoonwoonella zoysiae]